MEKRSNPARNRMWTRLAERLCACPEMLAWLAEIREELARLGDPNTAVTSLPWWSNAVTRQEQR
jgi:hypothetical protein